MESEGNITRWEKKRKMPQNMHLTTIASRVVAQMLTSATSHRLDRETWAASSVLRVRTRPECPEDYLRELT